MKIHVVVDESGKVMGAIAQGATTSSGDEVIIRPAREGHRLHEIDVSEDTLRLSPAEFQEHLQGWLTKA